MKKLFGLAVVAIIFSSCSTQKSETTSDSTAVAVSEPVNTLTEQQKADGWKLLFDGQTMNGWTIFKGKENDTWEVVDGTLHCKLPGDSTATKRADLRTVDEYENFEFAIDWKISPKGNSGIMYLVTEEAKAAYETGPEYQLIDDANFPEKLEDWQKTGANYAMHPAPTAKPAPVGEWNHTRILVNNGHVEHWLNDVKVVEYDMASEEWKKAKATGKWKDTPGYGMSKRGHIALQDHGSEAWFKDIRIRKL